MTTTPLQAAASTPYDKWLDKPTPDSMGEVLSDLEPTLVREVNRYAGPKALLHGKARNIAVAAVRTFDPTRGAKLHSWVTTQLQQLNRYGQKLRPIYVPEATNRQAAELHSVQLRMNDELGREPTHEELADEIGISVPTVKRLMSAKPATVTESQLFEDPESGDRMSPGVSEMDTIGEAADMVYSGLAERDKLIYDCKMGLRGKAPMSNLQIARKLGVTPALISQRAKDIAQRILEGQGRVL